MYWAQALVAQKNDTNLSNRFTDFAKQLTENEEKIVTELNNAQGSPIDLEGYYYPNDSLSAKAMRPSATLNNILQALKVVS